MNPKIMLDVLDEVVKERQRQNDKWGDQYMNPRGVWLGILGEEFGEVCKAMIEVVADGEFIYGLPEMRKELIEVAAVAVAWVEALDRDGDQPKAIWKSLEELEREPVEV